MYYNTNQYKIKLKPRIKKEVVISFNIKNPHYKIWNL